MCCTTRVFTRVTLTADPCRMLPWNFRRKGMPKDRSSALSLSKWMAADDDTTVMAAVRYGICYLYGLIPHPRSPAACLNKK
jgi:hypothetical protein